VNLIGCLDQPTAGEVWLDGHNVAGISAKDLARVRAEKIGFIFQQFHMIPYLTAVENVMLAQYFHSMTDEDEALEAGQQSLPGGAASGLLPWRRRPLQGRRTSIEML
jgi:putative ABC transport system ATP-binding protein